MGRWASLLTHHISSWFKNYRLLHTPIVCSSTTLSYTFFCFTPGLFVKFPKEGSATCRGCILQASDNSAQVMDEQGGQVVIIFISMPLPVTNLWQLQFHIDENDLTVSGVQDTTLPKPIHWDVWAGKWVVITRGHFKGYHGLVKVQDASHIKVELDARLAASGQIRLRFKIRQVQLFVEYCCKIGVNTRALAGKTGSGGGVY